MLHPANRQIGVPASLKSSALLAHGALSYVSQSKLLQQTRDQAISKKPGSKGISKKSSVTGVAVPVSQAHGGSIAALNAHASEGTFSNATIKSADKYNSISLQKKTNPQKHRQLNLNDYNQAIPSATINIGNHPLSAKETTKKKSLIFNSAQAPSHGTFNFNEKVIASTASYLS
jgi:hypothetical protein